jgi:para-nitrobenzyl esterase
VRAILAILSAAAALLTALPDAAAAPPDAAVVTTTGGAVRGVLGTDYREFRGIPYAAPPVGALRWRPPAPARPWSGVRDATAPGSVCAQGYPTVRGSEDCLYLNVTTPRQIRGPLPVMVWIHGGGFVFGSGSDPSLAAAALANRARAVVVTLNYRLGPFGFLAHPGLDAESHDQSGDYGIQDQQAALRWVNANATAFGGDRGDITLFGESAGGASVCMNVLSPGAAGLFQRAIAESAIDCADALPNRDRAERRGRTMAGRVGCADLACLRALPARRVLAALSDEMGSWQPSYGGSTIPLPPLVAWRHGLFNRVPLLISTNRDEGTMFAGRVDDKQYAAALVAQFGDAAAAVLAQYPAADRPSAALARVTTDSFFSCPAWWTDTAASGFVPTYAVEFADEHAPRPADAPPYPYPLGAYHSAEIQYLFGHPRTPFTPAQQALADRMIDYWSRFARTGDPNGPGAQPIAPFHPGTAVIPALAPTGPARTDLPAAHHCAFWQHHVTPFQIR